MAGDAIRGRTATNFSAQAAEIVRVAFAPLKQNGRSRHFRQKNTMVLVNFFAASKTSLCCGDRAWYLRHSAAVCEFFLFILSGGPRGASWDVFGVSWSLSGCLWGPLGASLGSLGRLPDAFGGHLGVSGSLRGGLWVSPCPRRCPLLLPCCGDRACRLRHSQL